MSYAIVLRETGGPDKLRYEAGEVADPGPGEILIRHTVIGVNFHDSYVRSGLYNTLRLPGIPGLEAAAVEVGPGVSGFAVGDRIAYIDTSRWDAAESSSIYNFNLTVMEASLKFVLNATPTLIHDHNQALISYLFERLPDGYRSASPRQASQRGVFGCIEVGSRSNAESLYQTLRDERFVVARCSRS